MNLFDHYNPTTSYYLATLADFQALPNDVKIMYAVNEQIMWKAIAITDNNEPLVDVEMIAAQAGVPMRFAPGTTKLTSGTMQLRSDAAERLCQAAKTLGQFSKGRYGLHITDAYRPLAQQRQQFTMIRDQLAKTGLTGEDLYTQTIQLISDPDGFPPHTTGGTVDLTLYDVTTGETLWLGTPVDAIDTQLIHTWHCDLEQTERDLRVLLYGAMVLAGFVNYPLEWWHYSYGDQEWALRTGSSNTLYSTL